MNPREQLVLAGIGLRPTPKHRVHIGFGAHNQSPAFRRQN
jgi:hypothetical protein